MPEEGLREKSDAESQQVSTPPCHVIPALLTQALTPVPLGVDDGLAVPDPVVLVEGVLVAVSVTVEDGVRVPLVVGETEDVGVSAWRATSQCTRRQRSAE